MKGLTFSSLPVLNDVNYTVMDPAVTINIDNVNWTPSICASAFNYSVLL